MILRVQKHTSDFTVVSNETIRDSRLSHRAVGVLVYLLSMPDGVEVRATALSAARNCKQGEGSDAVLTALKELEVAGYLKRTKERRLDGTVKNVSVVAERPAFLETTPPGPENPDSAEPDSVFQAS